MPNDNLSCASTGSDASATSGRERKPLKVRATLLYDATPGTLATPLAVPQLERILEADRRRLPEFDISLAVYTSGVGAFDLIRERSIDAAAPEEADEAARRIALGIRALARSIIDADIPDRLIGYLRIVTCGMPGAGLAPGIPGLLERESLLLKAELESAGFTVQRVELRFAGMFDTLAELEAALSPQRTATAAQGAQDPVPLERPLMLLRND